LLCDDRGIFLEIADFIKGLGLTILRGVMEARKSKIWARFTVEVNSSILQFSKKVARLCVLRRQIASLKIGDRPQACCNISFHEFVCLLLPSISAFGISSYFIPFAGQQRRDKNGNLSLPNALART
jgi:hypothetical protein